MSILAFHAHAGGQNAGAVPPIVGDTCVPIHGTGLRVASWNTRGLQGSTASAQDFRERKHHCLQRLCDANDIVFLQETHGWIEFLRALSTIHTRW